MMPLTFGEDEDVLIFLRTLARDAPLMSVERTRHIIVEMYAATKTVRSWSDHYEVHSIKLQTKIHGGRKGSTTNLFVVNSVEKRKRENARKVEYSLVSPPQSGTPYTKIHLGIPAPPGTLIGQ